jgi:nitroimidazol reductase NimA-like FMN-containing flavoprotein (pyridoxamine 5'-phosphate oxidase superfamily)
VVESDGIVNAGHERVRTWYITLGPEECRDRLARSTLGRLAVVTNGRPEIFPVNHVYDSVTDTIVFPTREGTKLTGALDWPWVAFEVDGVDPSGDSGWSVMVVGHAEEVHDSAEIVRIAPRRSARWANGPSARWVRIVPTKVSGRTISADTW